MKGYMCKVDFEYEVGYASGGNMVFPSVEDCRRCRPCVAQCGIVQVEIKFKRVVQKGKND